MDWFMSLHKMLPLIALTALLAVPCFAAVVIPENEALTKGDDPRLDQRVAFDADGATLSTALTGLGNAAGVEMLAGINKDDWLVQDRKVILHVRDMKLFDLMQEISRVLSYHWSRGGEKGKWTYRLWQDKEESLEEENLRRSEEDAKARAAREKRENAIADMVNLGSLGESDAANLKSTDPWRYLLATEPLGRELAEFIGLFPEARNAFVQGQSASFPVATLSPQLQNSVRRIAESYDSLTRSIGASEDHSDLLSKFDKLQITINKRSIDSTDVMSQSMLGRINVGTPSTSIEIPLFDPSSPIAKALATAVLKLRAGASKDAVGKQLQSDMVTAVQVTQTITQSTRDISSDPALRANIQLFNVPTNATLPMTLKPLAEKAKLNVISDYFAQIPPSMSSADKPLGKHLEDIAAAYGTGWVKDGNLLRLRNREWYKKRAWEVPQAWIDYWIMKGKKDEGLRLDEFAQIGNLRDEQIDHTITVNTDLMALGAGDASRNRQILRFYASLLPDQRKQLTAQPMAVGSLNEAQWTLLQKALGTKGAAYAATARGSQSIQLTQSGSDITEYKFTYFPGGTDAPVVFTLVSGTLYKTADEVNFPERPKQ